MATEDGKLYPVVSEQGVKVMSMNLLLDEDDSPVVWRGPVISGAVKQFYTDVVWEDVDYMYVDMPPGTGDVPLTVFQSLPVDGIVIVTTPQDLVSMIVGKAVKMAEMMDVKILGKSRRGIFYSRTRQTAHNPRTFGENGRRRNRERRELPRRRYERNF